MLIEIKRFEFATNYTVGRLFVDGSYVCYTLEDAYREKEGVPVEQWKIYGSTAIPKGTYKVKYTFSEHFQKNLPQILDVPGYSGVRIHTGNSDQDTEGCVLVGTQWAGTDWITGSKEAYNKFMMYFSSALYRQEQVTLTVS